MIKSMIWVLLSRQWSGYYEKDSDLGIMFKKRSEDYGQDKIWALWSRQWFVDYDQDNELCIIFKTNI